MVSEELRRFYEDNPLVYGGASREDLEQLAGIFELYPDSARLLSDREAVELPYLDDLVIDRRRAPLMALKKDRIASAHRSASIPAGTR